MKTSKMLICSVVLVWLLSASTFGAVPILWQADPDGSGVVTNNNSISRVKLTPDKNNVMVFHYNGGAYGIPTRVDKLDASTGNFVWPLPGYKTVTKPGERISLNGWVDGSGNLFIMGSWSGNTIWKYDSELATQLRSYTGGSGFEYVMDAMTDEFDNIYVSGMTGSWSNQGSRLVKLDENCNQIWTCLSKNTSQKDDYGRGIVLDSSKNVFRVGMDSSPGEGVPFRGRLIGHNASNGAEFLNYTVNETNSGILGITIDSDDYIYIAYCYGYTTSGQERTVVQKLERVGNTANVLWEYRFEDIGMYLGRDTIVKHTGNSFYVAFNLRQGGTTLPGIAEFDLNGNLLWKDTIDRPGLWNLSSIDATDNYIYVGLTNYADGSQTQVLCLAALEGEPEWSSLSGIVFDDLDHDSEIDTGEEVAGAVVSCQGHSATTGSDGKYSISGLSPGKATVEVKFNNTLYKKISYDIKAGMNICDLLINKDDIDVYNQFCLFDLDPTTSCIASAISVIPVVGNVADLALLTTAGCDIAESLRAGDEIGFGIAYIKLVAEKLLISDPGTPLDVIYTIVDCAEGWLREFVYENCGGYSYANLKCLWDGFKEFAIGGALTRVLPLLAVFTGSPVDIRICDMDGGSLELDDAGFISNTLSVPGFVSRWPDERELSIVFDANGTYIVEIIGRAEAGAGSTFNLQIMRQFADGTQRLLTYSDVPIAAGGIARAIASEEIDPLLEVDVDGDGTIDLNLMPDLPNVKITLPGANDAVQDGVTFTADANDADGIAAVSFYIREPNDGNGVPIGQEDLAATFNPATGKWECAFDTTVLPDGYYVVLAKAVDVYGNEGWSEVVPFSIRNWAIIPMLPSTPNSKAGRTMPVKFSIRIAQSVDPAMPFVYNDELEIRIYDKAKPSVILQRSVFGSGSRDYRIDMVAKMYITNFKTGTKPATYVVEIWRPTKNFEVGSFTFKTVK